MHCMFKHDVTSHGNDRPNRKDVKDVNNWTHITIFTKKKQTIAQYNAFCRLNKKRKKKDFSQIK